MTSIEVKVPLKRITVFIPTGLGYLLNLVSEYQFIKRSELYERIWREGLRIHLGLEEDELNDLTPAPLRFGAVPPEDAHKLVDLLLR